MFMIPLGLVIAVSTRVGNELGAGNAASARRATGCAMGLALAVTAANGGILFGFRDAFARSFVPPANESLYALVNSFVPYLLAYHVLDGLCEVVNGAFEGMGRQQLAFPVILVSHFAIGIPVSVVLGFRCGLGVVGLIIGRVVGKTINTVVFLALIARTDWDLECERAARLVEESGAAADGGRGESAPLLADAP